jgi:hypothetical protein
MLVLVGQHTAKQYVCQNDENQSRIANSSKLFFKQWECLAEAHFYTSILRLQVFFHLEKRKRHSPPQEPNLNGFLAKNATQRLSQMQRKGPGLKSQCVHFCFYCCSNQALTLCDTTKTLASTLTFASTLPLPLPLPLPLSLPLLLPLPVPSHLPLHFPLPAALPLPLPLMCVSSRSMSPELLCAALH